MASRRWPTVDYGRANPGALNVGHAGTGGLTHLSALLFLTRANVQATMVPYRGGAQALSDVLAGQIDLYSASVSEVIPYTTTGKLSLLAVSNATRLAQLPALPTIAETYPGYAVETWNGRSAPPACPRLSWPDWPTRAATSSRIRRSGRGWKNSA